MLKPGTRWSSSDGKVFVVINTANLENKEWVYYRAEKPKEDMPQEFSCYVESFLSRFTSLPE